MIGAILQTRNIGPQDVFLTGKPDINFIKQVYRQYDNFAIEDIKILANEKVDFGNLITFNIKHDGDYLYKLFFCFSLPILTPGLGSSFCGWTNSLGHAIIEYCDFEINGNRINRMYGLFMEIWHELSITTNPAKDLLIGKYSHPQMLMNNASINTDYRIPLQFWFSSNISSALPLFKLSRSTIKISIQLKRFDECIIYDGIVAPNTVSIKNSYLHTQYIFIADTLKNIIKNQNQVFLIEQLQTATSKGDFMGLNSRYKGILQFNHPVKELLFVAREIESENNNDWFNFSIRNGVINTPILPLIQSAKLVIDGRDRCTLMDSFSLSILNSSIYHTNTTDKYIYTMPFCDCPEKWIPTGSLNFSAVDSAVLYIDIAQGSIPRSRIFIYARNYNWLSISNGFAKLLFNS